MTRVRLTEQAARQLEEALAHIEQENPHAANALRERVASTLKRLELFPFSGFPTDEEGVLYAPVRRTRYLIFYAIDDAGIRIFRIRHGARSPVHRS